MRLRTPTAPLTCRWTSPKLTWERFSQTVTIAIAKVDLGALLADGRPVGAERVDALSTVLQGPCR